jgi:hypothetical protein
MQHSFDFTIRGDQGAIFVAKHELRRQEVQHHTPLRTHILQNYASWLDYAQKTQPSLRLEDLILVTGRDMGGATVAAAYSDSIGVLQEVTFTPSTSNERDGTSNWGVWSCSDTSLIGRSLVFRASSALAEPSKVERTIFLRGYRIKHRSDASVLASPSSMEDDHITKMAPLALEQQAEALPDDPLTPLFDYIFEVCQTLFYDAVVIFNRYAFPERLSPMLLTLLYMIVTCPPYSRC